MELERKLGNSIIDAGKSDAQKSRHKRRSTLGSGSKSLSSSSKSKTSTVEYEDTLAAAYADLNAATNSVHRFSYFFSSVVSCFLFVSFFFLLLLMSQRAESRKNLLMIFSDSVFDVYIPIFVVPMLCFTFLFD